MHLRLIEFSSSFSKMMPEPLPLSSALPLTDSLDNFNFSRFYGYGLRPKLASSKAETVPVRLFSLSRALFPSRQIDFLIRREIKKQNSSLKPKKEEETCLQRQAKVKLWFEFQKSGKLANTYATLLVFCYKLQSFFVFNQTKKTDFFKITITFN